MGGGSPLHIAFCTDENYAKYTGVAITSIILNNIGEKLCFHIVYDDINETEKEKFLLLEKLYINVQVKLYEFQDIEKVASYKTGYHFTKAMYYRIFLPHVVSEDIQKILYLDGDILCLGNIAPLFEMDLHEFSLMAFYRYNDEDKIRLQLTSNKVLYSGQLLIDTVRWRRENTTAKLLQILNDRHEEFTWVDNDAINCLFNGRFAEMPEVYARMVDCNAKQPIEIKKDDKILHYLGSVKPWKTCCFHDVKNIWWEYAKKSFWHDLKKKEPQTLNEAIFIAKKLAETSNYQEAVRYYDTVVNYLMNRNIK